MSRRWLIVNRYPGAFHRPLGVQVMHALKGGGAVLQYDASWRTANGLRFVSTHWSVIVLFRRAWKTAGGR